MRSTLLGLLALLMLAACQGNPTKDATPNPSPPNQSPTPNNPINPNPPAPQPPITNTGNWSDPATWGGSKPKAGEVATVRAGQRVILDENTPDLAGLTILGELEFARKDLNLTADWIMLHGALKIGSEAEPFAQKATITLEATDTAQNLMNMGTRGVLLMDGGQLSLFGAKPKFTWTKINANAALGATSLTLKDSVNWKAGDQIVLAPTAFFPFNQYTVPDPAFAATERLELSSASGTSVGLRTGIIKARYGQLQYVTNTGLSNSPTTSVTPLVLDERAAVGNLSRNIVIQAPDDNLWKTQGFGAHIMAMRGSYVRLDGVELRRVGQLFRSGRYPVHFHMNSYDADTGAELGDASSSFVRNSAIWDSSNRCVTIHATNGITFSGNICYDITGHAVFLEDASERRNRIENNLVVQVRQPPKGNAAPAVCTRILDGQRSCAFLAHDQEASAFWLTNPDNTVRGNHAADAEGKGYWLAFPKQTLGLSSKVNFRPDRMRFGVFENNTAHSNGEGIHIDNAPTKADPGQLEGLKYIPMLDTYNRNVDVDYDFSKWLRFELKNITLFKNGGNWGSGGFWNRVSWPDYVNWVVADNTGTAFAGAGDNGMIKDSLIIGNTLNVVPAPQNFTENPRNALASYHSTFDMQNNVVVNFPFSTRAPGGGAFKTDDYYITGVDKGLVRNPGNRLINSSPGYRLPPPNLRPDAHPNGRDNWTLAGALWDAHGYWGAAGNYWVYNNPFLTTGANCQPAIREGTTRDAANGMSCDGQYYGVGDWLTQFDTRRYAFMAPLEVIRQDSSGAEIGHWTVANGDISNMLGNMRHFAARTGGRYVVRFPKTTGSGYDLPTWLELSVSNSYRTTDWFLLGLSFDGTVNPSRVFLDFRERRTITATTSLANVEASDGSLYWRDTTNNLLWVKIRGGLNNPDHARELTNSPNSDFALYGLMRLFVNR